MERVGFKGWKLEYDGSIQYKQFGLSPRKFKILFCDGNLMHKLSFLELQTDENHFTILLAVFSEKLDNLFLHEEMQGAIREPDHLPLRILSLVVVN